VECLFVRSPGHAPHGAKSACAKRAAYPDPPPVVPPNHPESLAVLFCSTYYQAVRVGVCGGVCLLLQYLLQNCSRGGESMFVLLPCFFCVREQHFRTLGHTGGPRAFAEDMGQNMSAVAGCCDKRDEDFKRKRSVQGGRDGKLRATPSRKACSVQLLIAACSIGLARVLADADSRPCRNRRPGAASGAVSRAVAACGTVSAYPRMLGATGFPSRGSVHTPAVVRVPSLVRT
jgi:hypothetical protein